MKCQGLVVFAGDPPGDSVSVSMDLLLVGVVFFPSLLFMGVVLFPSFVLGNTSGEGGTFLVSLFLFSLPLSLPPFPSPSHLFPLSFHTLSSSLSFPSIFLSFFRTSSFCFFVFFLFFCFFLFFFVLRELLILFISEM